MLSHPFSLKRGSKIIIIKTVSLRLNVVPYFSRLFFFCKTSCTKSFKDKTIGSAPKMFKLTLKDQVKLRALNPASDVFRNIMLNYSL